MFTVDDIEIQQLEDAESSEEIEPSFGPAVGDRGKEEGREGEGEEGRGEEGKGEEGREEEEEG